MTRINYTGRKRIGRDRVKLRLTSNGAVRVHADAIDLKGLALPAGARIIMQAQRRTRFMRFDCGTVGRPGLPDTMALTEFDFPQGLRFRILVVGTSGSDEGKILAAADGVTATSPSDIADRASLLPTVPADLGQRLWRLEVSDGGWPELQINKKVGDWHGFAGKPEFQALVLPDVLRQIAIWTIEHLDDAMEPDTPAGAWRAFFVGTIGSDPGADAPPDEDGRAEWARDWAEQTVDRFCRQHKFCDLLVTASEEND